MFRPGQVDRLKLSYVRAFGLIKRGAMRSLASFIADGKPDAFAVCEIEPGDALSLATRFALQWAYRGRQAIFWSDAFSTADVSDLYLPSGPLERRGFVCVNAAFRSRRCTLITTQFSDVRKTRISELRFVRTRLRETEKNTLLFVHLNDRRIAFEDLGFRDVTPLNESEERIYVRGFEDCAVTANVATS